MVQEIKACTVCLLYTNMKNDTYDVDFLRFADHKI